MRRATLTLAVAAVSLMAAACSDGGDDDGGFLGGATTGTDQPAVPGSSDEGSGGFPGAGDGSGGGYTESSQANFVDVCTSYEGATTDVCECAWDEVTQRVPYEEYARFETTVASQGPPDLQDLPGFIVTAVASCS